LESTINQKIYDLSFNILFFIPNVKSMILSIDSF
jgi:hypothetical protein